MHPIIRCAAIFLLLLIPLTTSAQQQLTVEDIYGSDRIKGESLTGVEWVPDGSGFTYLHDNEETEDPEIWLYEIESGKRILLADSERVTVLGERKREKRFTLSNYIWSPSSNEILFPYEDDLYLYYLNREELIRLTMDEEGERDPQFSPNGKKLAYLKYDNLCVLDIETGEETQLTKQGEGDLLIGRFDWVYEEEFDIRTGFSWSPDSEHIAYYQVDQSSIEEFPIVDFLPVHNEVDMLRYAKAGDPNSVVQIGVVSLQDSNGTVWMDIGEETDIYIPRIKWLPHGGELAIQRLNRKQNRLDLLFADIRTGASRVVLTEESVDGWIDANDDLTFFLDGEWFLWTSQRDGFKHLYVYHVVGWLKERLTRGDWDVQKVKGVDEITREVYFVANEKSIFESHLYRVNLDSKRFMRLTYEEGSHYINMSPKYSHYLDTFSNITTPYKVVLGATETGLKKVLEPNEMRELLDNYDLSVPEFISVPTDEGFELNAFIIKPPGFDPTKKYPVLIYTYGGPGSQIVYNTWRRGYGSLWHQLMAQQGYIVFGLDNRGTDGRGTEWLWSVYRTLGEYEVQDHVHGVKYLRTLPYVDGNRIGIWGWSYGGYTTCMCLLKAPEYFQVGVAVASVTDWRNYDTIYTERYMGTPEDNLDGYERGAAWYYADQLQGKLLLVHGSSDDNVHGANTMQLAEALQNAGKQFDMMFYPGKAHSIRGDDTRVHLFEMITRYFLENL